MPSKKGIKQVSNCIDCGKELKFYKSKRCCSCASRLRATKGKTEEERFWEKVNKNGPTMPHMDTPCWMWTATKIKNDYGQFHSELKTESAHRYSYRIRYGPFFEILDICHHCDNPGCVNPEHLFIGTHQDNMQDKKEKGRVTRLIGTKNKAAKLTDNQVIEIRKLFASGTSIHQLAKTFCVSRVNIRRIVNMNIWKHIIVP